MTNVNQQHTTQSSRNILILGLGFSILLIGMLFAPAVSGYSRARIYHGEVVAPTNPGYWSAVELGKIENDGSYQMHCTGALIGSTTILSAAHCFYGDRSQYNTVRFFNHGMNGNPDFEEFRPISEVKIQEDYADSIPEFDIALVRFTGDLPLGFHPIELLPSSIATEPDDSTITVGFGGAQSGRGKKLYATVVKKQVVSNYWTRGVFAVVFKGDQSAIPGDSGGPTYVQKLGQWYLEGVTSGDSTAQFPLSLGAGGGLGRRMIGAFTATFKFWLQKNTSDTLIGKPATVPVYADWDPASSDQASIIDLCTSQKLSKPGFYTIRDLVYRAENFDCHLVADFAKNITAFHIDENTPMGVIRDLPALTDLSVSGEVDLKKKGVRLERLSFLTFQDAKMPPIDVWSELSNLEGLKLGEKASPFPFELDTGWVSRLLRLRVIQISGYRLRSVVPLLEKESLKRIFVNDAGLAEIPTIDRTSRLEELDLSNNSLTSVVGLETLPVERLNLDYNQIQSISPLGKNPFIRLVRVTHNPTSDHKCPLPEGQGVCIFEDRPGF